MAYNNQGKRNFNRPSPRPLPRDDERTYKGDDKRPETADVPMSQAEADENLIFGRNVVMEALKSGRSMEKIFLRKGDREGSVKVIAARAKEMGIPFVEVASVRLDEMTGGGAHQGVAALVSAIPYHSLDELVSMAEAKGESPFFVILDDINDPHNLGAILRSAECCGVNGVILPKRHSAPLSSVALKASAGAANYLPIAKVTNISDAMDRLKEKGIWIYGAEAGGQPLFDSDMTGSTAVVMGSEGNGLSRLVRAKCDFILSIPMYGKINSFNVSCAASVILTEAARQRNKKQ